MSRPSFGCASAIATSMPIALSSSVWWMVAHKPYRNIARYKYPRCCGAYIHRIKHNSTAISHGTPNSEMRLMTTDSLHMKISRPSSNPATQPETTQMEFSHRRGMSLITSMPSINMLLPRDTMKASIPQPMAAAKDWPTSTRHATLPIGRIHVQNHAYTDQNG